MSKTKFADSVAARLEMSEHEFRYVCYSPKKNEVVLARGIEICVDRNNQQRVSFKREKGVHGQTMRLDIFEKHYPIFLGDLGLGQDYFDLREALQ